MGQLSGSSPLIVTTANGSDVLKRPARLRIPLALRESCSRDEFDILVPFGKVGGQIKDFKES